MNIQNIIIKKQGNRIPYLTELLPNGEIPTNTILHKKLTGLGATFSELKARRNSIIIEPNRPVIIGKCEDPEHRNDNLFGVCHGVYTDDIIDYIEGQVSENTDNTGEFSQSGRSIESYRH